MKRILPWMITILLMVIFLFIEPDRSTFIVIRVVADVLVVLIGGITITALFAFIPFRKRTYVSKFKTLLPIACSILLISFITAFGYTFYLDKIKGVKLYPPQTFESLKISSGLDCSTIKVGKFILGDDTIERQTNLQIETNGRTKEKTIYKVEWPTDYEYDLIPSDSTKKIMIKVTDVNPAGYICYRYSKGSNSTIRYTIKKILPNP